MQQSNPFLTLAQLQTTFTVAEYQQLLAHPRTRYSSSTTANTEPARTFWARLPTYVIARCPFCDAVYTEQVDTHSLQCWTYLDANKWYRVFGAEIAHDGLGHPRHGCPHLFALQTHLNLNDVIPTEVDRLQNNVGDVPYVVPAFVPNDIRSIAVLHSLPLCRIEQNQFIPRYLVYIIAYYAEDGPRIMQRMKDREEAANAHDREWSGVWFHPYQPESYDLERWIAQGKLRWLDPSASPLHLLGDKGSAFPYARITGFRCSYTYIRQPTKKDRAAWYRPLWNGPEGLIYQNT